eukprot:9843846-Alexandrium_andersonii.AAC.1
MEREQWAAMEEAKDPAPKPLFEEAHLAMARAAATKLGTMLCLIVEAKTGKSRQARGRADRLIRA